MCRVVRQKVGTLIEHWQKICILAERVIRRREAAAVRLTPILGRSYLPTHLSLPPFSPAVSSSSNSSDVETGSTSSFLSALSFGSSLTNTQADLSRMTNTFKSLVEVNTKCWRGDECDLCAGVRQGLTQVSAHTQKHVDALEHRVSLQSITGAQILILCQSRNMLYSTLEALKVRIWALLSSRLYLTEILGTTRLVYRYEGPPYPTRPIISRSSRST